MMRVLVVEPYGGGSHQAFLDGLQHQLAGEFVFELLTLPARGWKWRMRLAAPFFADLIRQRLANGDLKRPDQILCSSLLDVATFKALLPPAWQGVPLLLYFHENQFAYPVRVVDLRDLHFALTNYTSALAADRPAFNSRYNLETFLAGCRETLVKAPDMLLAATLEAIRGKSVVLSPGLDGAAIDAERPSAKGEGGEPEEGGPPVILWNHRWEHDKQPEVFLAALRVLAADDFPFRLIVAGQGFARSRELCAGLGEEFGARLIHCGFLAERVDYHRLLHRATVVVSTAAHEFFGLAVLEAVRAGCRPLLPNRLAYPELFPPEYLYHDEADLVPALKAACRAGRLAPATAVRLTAAHDWPSLAPRYHQWLAGE